MSKKESKPKKKQIIEGPKYNPKAPRISAKQKIMNIYDKVSLLHAHCEVMEPSDIAHELSEIKSAIRKICME